MLVDAVFDRMSVMSAAQLRELAGLLPQVEGNKGNPPLLPTTSSRSVFAADSGEEHDENTFWVR